MNGEDYIMEENLHKQFVAQTQMGERTGLVMGFLTVNRGFKSIRGGKYT